MIQRSPVSPEPDGPYLELLYDTAPQPRRYPVQHDALVIGRSRGCDLILEAPDISSVHCVLARTHQGWSIRDCHSRAGIKVNGEPVEEIPLQGDDLLQIGPFSFRFHLPPAPKGTSAGAGTSAGSRQV